MSLFASKSAFSQLGLEVIVPSAAHMYHDCYICNDPLNVNIHTNATEKHHATVRIGVCGHMHGKECLSAWLDTGNSCPTCKRQLFEASGRGITQSDINNVVHSMRRSFHEKDITAAIARLVGRQEVEQAQLQRKRDEEVKKLQDTKAQDDVMDDDDYWRDSGDEEDFGEAEDTDEDFVMGEGGSDESAASDDDGEPQSATV